MGSIFVAFTLFTETTKERAHIEPREVFSGGSRHQRELRPRDLDLALLAME